MYRVEEVMEGAAPNGWQIYPKNIIKDYFINKGDTTIPDGFINQYEYYYTYSTLIGINRDGIDYLIPFRTMHIVSDLVLVGKEKVVDLKTTFKKEITEFLPSLHENIDKEINKIKKNYIIPEQEDINIRGIKAEEALIYKVKK